MNFVRIKLGFTAGYHVNSIGTKGGLSLLWNDSFSVQILSSSSGHIDSIINYDEKVFRFTGFYGNPDSTKRRFSWDLLRRLKNSSSLPWLCAGDFNEILHWNEKTGAALRARYLLNNFRSALSDCELNDLGFSGSKFTWHNGRSHGNVKARLDRAVASCSWINLFPTFSVTHLSSSRSDHLPILISDKPFQRKKIRTNGGVRRFDPYWLQDNECLQVASEVWKESRHVQAHDFVAGFQQVREALSTWSASKFGNLRKKINQLQDSLFELQQKEDFDIRQEKLIMKELDHLLNLEEDYWQQRGRTHWLMAGDKNTSFFHAKATRRLNKNRVEVLRTEEGVELTSQEDLSHHVKEYYSSLFKSGTDVNSKESRMKAIGDIPANTISALQATELLKPYTNEEVIKALKQMPGRKSPGPDGMQAIFLKHHWNLYEQEVMSFVLNVLNNKQDFTAINDTCIALIPKCANASTLKDFRPISLSNSIYKIISKVLANRLKKTLNSVIDQAQSAFQKGKLITDNAIAAFEAFHTLNGPGRWGRTQMALKLDMMKAFDKVEWDYLEALLTRMHYPSDFVSLIMGCVKTVSFQVLVNGKPTSRFWPTRGIRQGDPLSPFLFILCSEGFSALIRKEILQGNLVPFRFGRSGPCLSHLLFADDSILFAKASPENAHSIMEVLRSYEAISGQKINLSKSNVYFNKHLDFETADTITHILGVPIGNSNGRYLGLPFMIGKTRYEIFKYLKDRIWRKITGWKAMYLTNAGNEVMIKAVLQAIPVYVMQYFDLPKELLDEILTMIRRFWWGKNTGDERPVAWLSWDKLCLPKSEGGLGIRDLRLFNKALLAKQSWRIFSNPHSLVSQIVKFKYHKSDPFLEAGLGSRPSFIWRSLTEGKKLLLKGLRWKVGNGQYLNVWRHKWIPLEPNFVVTTYGNHWEVQTVDQLIEDGNWNT